MRTFARFALLLLAFGLLPVGGVLREFSRSNAVARANARSFHAQIARLAAEEAERTAAQLNRALAFAARLEEGNLPPGGETALLRQAAFSDANVLSAGLYAASGARLARWAAADFPETEAVWEASAARAAASGKVAFGSVRVGRGRPPDGAEPYLPVVYPLADGRTVRAAYGLAALARRLSGLRAGADAGVLLAQGGTPLAGFGAPSPGTVRLPARGGPDPGRGGPSGWSEDVRAGREPLVGAWAEVPSLGWTAWSLQPRAAAFAVGEDAAARALRALAGLLILVGAAALWVSARVSAPLWSLAEAARRAGAGRFDSPAPERGWGEFRECVRVFNVMMRSLEKYRRLQVDKQLAEKARLEALVRVAPSGIVLAEAGGKLLYVNRAARGVLDTASLTSPGGLRAAEVLREPRLIELLKLALAERGRLHVLELEVETGGRHRAFFCSARAVERGASLYGALLVLHEVTAERELEALRERFLHALAHDLRAPISSIAGWIELLEGRGLLPPAAARGLAMVRSATRNMTELVENVLDSAKLKAGGVRPNRAPVAAAELLEEVRGLFAFRAELRQVALRAEAPEGLSVFCDRRLIARALGNLVGNALKYTPQGGSVVLRAAASPAGAEFSVADTGHGIPKEKLASVFLPFEQASAEDQATGFGLGLSLVKEFVELHGGAIRVESPGKGTRFVFTLPGAPGGGPAPGGAPGAPASAPAPLALEREVER